MAITTSTITGFAPIPTGAAPISGQLVFTLNRYDTEGANVLLPASKAITLGAGGKIPDGFSLWRNTEGLRGTYYIVQANWTEHERGLGKVERTCELGRIQVGGNTSYTLAELLEAGTVPAEDSFWSAITQTEFDEIKQLAGDAEAAASSAAASAAAAEAALEELEQQVSLNFKTRDALKDAIAATPSLNSKLSDGDVVMAGGLAYRFKTGASVIPDLAWWEPVPPVYLEHYGVVTSDGWNTAPIHTVATQAAFANTRGVLHITGWVKVNDRVDCANGCTPISIRGAQYGGLVVGPTFNMSAPYVYRPGSSEPGSQRAVLGIHFQQPTNAISRSDLYQYPWAICFASPDDGAVARATFEHLRIQGSWNGLRMEGNCGGTTIGRVEIGGFNTDLLVDGPLDFINIGEWRSWCFAYGGFANLYDLYRHADTRAAVLKQCDGFHAGLFTTFRKSVEFDAPMGILPHTFGSLKLDGDGARLIGKSGHMQIAELYSTDIPESEPSIVVEGADIAVGLAAIGGAANPQVEVTSGMLKISGGRIHNHSLTHVGMDVKGGALALDNIEVSWMSGVRTAPMIKQSGTGRLIVSGLFPASVADPAPIIQCQTDVTGNSVDVTSIAPHTAILPAGVIANGQYWTARASGPMSVSFATPGNLSVSYGVRSCWWRVDGDWIDYSFRLSFTPTFSSASGALILTGPSIPLSSQTSDVPLAGWNGPIGFTGGRGSLWLRRLTDGTMRVLACGPGVGAEVLTAGHFTSGQTVELFVSTRFLLRA